MPIKVNVRNVQVDWTAKKEYEKKLQAHERFTVVPKRVHRIRFFKSDKALLDSYGNWRTSALAWSEGVLIIEESAHVTVLLDRMHVQTYYYHDNHHDNLDKFLYKPLEVEVGTILYKNAHTYVVLTRRPVLTDVFNKLVENNEPFEAEIVKFTNFGAFLRYHDLRIRIKNCDFTDNPTLSLRDVYHIGDKIEVVPSQYNTAHVDLSVKLKNYPYKFDPTVTWKNIERGKTYQGTVKYWSPTGVYVRLYPGVDGLTTYPHNSDLDIGSKVLYKVTSIDSKTHKLRGKLMKIMPELNSEHIDTKNEKVDYADKENAVKQLKTEIDNGSELNTDLINLTKQMNEEKDNNEGVENNDK